MDYEMHLRTLQHPIQGLLHWHREPLSAEAVRIECLLNYLAVLQSRTAVTCQAVYGSPCDRGHPVLQGPGRARGADLWI